MPAILTDSLTAFVGEAECRYASEASIEDRKARGQFFTPGEVARLMASLFDTIPRGRETRIVDAGAGLGALSAAICDRLRNLKVPRRVRLIAYEIDSGAVPVLRETLSRCREQAANWGHDFAFEICEEDFVNANASAIRSSGDFFSGVGVGEIDLAIMNPPYFKLPRESAHAKIAEESIGGMPNIYALFMAVAAGMLRPGGQLVAITPRSFCNGRYFRPFRRWMAGQVGLERVHLFDSRSSTFHNEDVLQESLITSWRKGGQPADIQIGNTHDGQGALGGDFHQVEATKVIERGSGDLMIRIPSSEEEEALIDAFGEFGDSFQGRGLRISTGPVVTFRTREHLLPAVNGDPYVPLFSAHNIKRFAVEWPVEKRKKPVAFALGGKAEKHLVENRNYVLLKRFTSKEEKRRLAAGCFIQSEFDFEQAAFENHINYVYHADRELTIDETYGVAALFNSALYDRYFRLISGNTQVNATEVRTLPFPPLEVAQEIGEGVRTAGEGDAEELCMDNLGVGRDLRRYLQGFAL